MNGKSTWKSDGWPDGSLYDPEINLDFSPEDIGIAFDILPLPDLLDLTPIPSIDDFFPSIKKAV